MQPPTAAPLRCRVLIVEDSLFVIEALTEELKLRPGLELVAVASSTAGAIEQFKTTSPAIVVLDLNLAPGNGFDVLRHIRIHNTDCHVVVYSGHDAPALRERALAEGAAAFVSKARSQDELITVIES